MEPTVETTFGAVEGLDRDGVLVFHGVPFAAPPLGDLRWRSPRPMQPWPGVREAKTRPPAPPQGRSPMEAVSRPRSFETSEDCLYLDVWTPSCDDARRPVLVWIHGGGVVLGWGSDPVYDGVRLCRRGDVVLVTVGYRLGALGVVAHPDLIDPETGCTGNWNLQDQIAALRWVQREIAAFGGDPERVTVFGESAGGMSTGTLFGVPAARGLFHRGIAQSGGARATPLDEAAAYTEKLAADLGCSVGGLRAVPAEEVVAAQLRTDLFGMTIRGGGFTVDGVLLPRAPLESIRAGANPDAHLIAGTTMDEAKIGIGFAGGRPADPDDATLRGYVSQLLGGSGDPDAVISVFRTSRAARGEPASNSELVYAIDTEFRYRQLSLELAEAQLAVTPDVWTYIFTWESRAFDGLMGACHGIDIPFTFGTLSGGKFTGPIEDEDRLVSDRMQDAWRAFAARGDPSHPSVGEWPRYDFERRPTMFIGPEFAVHERYHDPERRTWAG